MVWVIHMISPSTYDESRFNKMAEGLLEQIIGVICSPSTTADLVDELFILSATNRDD